MPSSAVSSGAIFSRETIHTEDPVKVFENPENHLTALASIVVYSAGLENFKPASQPPKSLADGLHGFISKVSTFPGLFMVHHTQRDIKIDGSLIHLEKVVRESITHHGTLIGRSIRDLFPGYVPDPTLNEWTLSLIGGEKTTNAEVMFHIVTLKLKVEIDKSYTTRIPVQSTSINVSTFRVLSSFLTSNAEKLADMIPIVSVRDAIDFFASPKVIPSDEDDSWSFACHKDASVFDRLSKQRILAW
ncbi:hypothetical protein BGW41_003472 [Actinomortierella wolfii]|nr:hypothetical protein BGW41_003472 [Actinomortierella wolfii]